MFNEPNYSIGSPSVGDLWPTPHDRLYLCVRRIADNREYFIGPIEGYYYCTSIQVLVLSQLFVVFSNTCSTFKYFAVSASRLLQVLLLYPLNDQFHLLNEYV